MLCLIRVCNNYDELSSASVGKPTQQRMKVPVGEPSTGSCKAPASTVGLESNTEQKTCLAALTKKNDM